MSEPAVASDTSALLRQGDLDGLRSLLAGRVRSEPSQAGHRLALADILILQGELEKADNQLEIAAQQDTQLALPVALTRQLIRAATARAETFSQRRPPELVAEADPAITAALAKLAGADVASQELAELQGTIDGRAFTGLRDGDDRTADILEVLTSTGKYVWVSFAQVGSLKLAEPERPRDLVWRQAELEVRGGPSGVVYLPTIYPAAIMSDAQRLGRETDWIEEGDQTVGVGLRTFLVGDDAVALGEFTELAVAA
jgi:type VI secretion system protein ImpE